MPFCNDCANLRSWQRSITSFSGTSFGCIPFRGWCIRPVRNARDQTSWRPKRLKGTDVTVYRMRPFFGSHCYVVTQAGARRLLHRARPFEIHVDGYMFQVGVCWFGFLVCKPICPGHPGDARVHPWVHVANTLCQARSHGHDVSQYHFTQSLTLGCPHTKKGVGTPHRTRSSVNRFIPALSPLEMAMIVVLFMVALYLISRCPALACAKRDTR